MSLEKIRSHLNIPSIIAARRGKVLKNYRQQLLSMIPGLESSVFADALCDEYSSLGSQDLLFTGIDNEEQTIAYVRRFSMIADVVPVVMPHLPGSFSEIPLMRRFHDLLKSQAIDFTKEGLRVGGPTSMNTDSEIALNNGLLLAESRTTDPTVITEIPETKGGLIISRANKVSLHTADTLKQVFDPAKHTAAIGVSTAFRFDPEESSTEPAQLWHQAMRITQANGYTQSGNNRYGFLAETVAGYRYFDVHYDPNHLHLFSLELLLAEEEVPGIPIDPESMRVTVAVRLLLESLSHDSESAVVVGLEENTAVDPWVVDPDDVEHAQIFPLELQLAQHNAVER